MFLIVTEMVRANENWCNVLWCCIESFIVNMALVLSAKIEFRSPFQFLAIFSAGSTNLIRRKSPGKKTESNLILLKFPEKKARNDLQTSSTTHF